MGLSMTVDGSPASCRASARAVRRLGREVEQAGNGLARVRSLGLSGWSGEAAEQFGARTRRLIDASDTASSGVVTFADALDAQADAIEETKAEMQRARSVATKADIAIHGDSFPSYGEVDLKPAQEGPRDHGEAIVTRAREAEETANAAFEAAASAAESLVWTGEPVTPVARAKGPMDYLPDVKIITPVLPMGPLPVPIPVPVPKGLEIPLPNQSQIEKLALMLPTLLKLSPHAREAGITLSEKAGKTMLTPVTAGYDQLLEDQDRDDLSFPEKVRRATIVGSATATAGAGAAYACAQTVALAPLSPGCGLLGAEVGNRLSKKYLEFEDAH